MNKFTRVVAWCHVIGFGAVLFLISTLLGGGNAVIDALTGIVSKAWPHGASFIPPLAKLSGGTVVLTLAYVLVGFLVWVFLLRKQAWAWWGLMILIMVGIMQMIISRYPTDYPMLNTIVEQSPRATIGKVHFLALVTLAFDSPWNWRGRRSGTRRRRKSRSTTSSSSRARSRRRSRIR